MARIPATEGSIGVPGLVLLHPGPQSFTPLTQQIVVGRGDHCDLTLPDPAVSRVHATLSPTSSGVEVVDASSHNGTFVDGQRITRVVVNAPAVLRIGETVLRLGWFTERWEPTLTVGPLVGGTALRSIRRQIALVGPTTVPTLITGETGTGKDVVARLIHEASGRKGPFIAVNCSALPEALVESELFGHAQGAFTGAQRAHRGLFASASGGTLFLDEVGDLSSPAQAKLLRVLEDGMVRPVGSDRSERVDVRVVSATNRDLAGAVEAGRFRADLFARLGGVQVILPPLRARPEDLTALAAHLLERAGVGPLPLDADAVEALALHSWPMNIRELDSALRSAVLGGADRVTLARLPEQLRLGSLRQRSRGRGHTPTSAPLDTDRLRVEAALRTHLGNVRRASNELGVARSQMYRLLKRYSLSPESFRS